MRQYQADFATILRMRRKRIAFAVHAFERMTGTLCQRLHLFKTLNAIVVKPQLTQLRTVRQRAQRRHTIIANIKHVQRRS